MSGTHSFLPWVRQGVATAIRNTDTLGPGIPGHASLPVMLRVNEREDAEVASQIRVYGPGDIIGIDSRHVIRTEPRHLTTGFEPNYFPAIEFDRPDFPWLFMPAAADERARLRPWLCLVAVRDREGVALVSEPSRPLPAITVPVDELPDLGESWAWAHTQVLSSEETVPVDELLEANPEQTLSRIICPRKLEPNTRYHACLVPAFEAGRKAGLGLPVTSDDERELRPAWSSDENAPAEVALPVYYHWQFSTSAAGDFESLLRLLQYRPLPAGVGTRPMEVSDLGAGLPDVGVLGLEGALRPPTARPAVEVPQAFRDGLRSMLNEAATSENDSERVVAPPIYGSWQAAQPVIPTDDAPPHWLRELSLDPRHRSAAGFGTLVVRTQQEQLMASAWEQLGEIEPANQALRQAQLAREVGRAIHEKRLSNMSADLLFRVTGPVHARVPLASRTTLHHRVRRSRLPAAADSGAFRRIVRPRGPLARRTLRARGDGARPLVQQLAAGQVEAAPPRPAPRGIASPENVFTVVEVREAMGTGSFAAAPGPPMEAFRAAAEPHHAYFQQAMQITGPEPEPALLLADIAPTLLERLNPDETVPRRVLARIGSREEIGRRETDSIEPITAAPEFPQHMYEPLRDLSQDLLLPGLEHVPHNTVTLLETNPPFIEAYMVGLNHEMSRELLWRNYPTDQRATYFRRFWALHATEGDAAAELAAAQSALRRLLRRRLRLLASRRDIGHVEAQIRHVQERIRQLHHLQERSDRSPLIHEWNGDNHLGHNLPGLGSEDRLVLLIRGELVRRYPTAVIYAVEAVRSPDGRRDLGQRELYPLFQGTMEPDVIFVGFDLTLQEARGTVDAAGNAGWFFIIQQQPTEPRFGLDSATSFGGDPNALGTWEELSWGHLVPDEESSRALSHVSVAGRLAGSRIDGIEWGLNAAHMGYITLQRPVRIAVHADDLLPTAQEEDE